MTSNYTNSKSTTVACPKCQAQNLSGATSCKQCGALLTRQVSYGPGSTVGNAGRQSSGTSLPVHPYIARPKIAYSPVKTWHKGIVFVVWVGALGLIFWM